MSTFTYKNSFGIKIEITTSFDCTGNTGVFFNVTKPNSAIVVWTPTVTNPTTGVMNYVTVEGDLDLEGGYRVQVEVRFSGKRFFAAPVEFRVTT